MLITNSDLKVFEKIKYIPVGEYKFKYFTISIENGYNNNLIFSTKSENIIYIEYHDYEEGNNLISENHSYIKMIKNSTGFYYNNKLYPISETEEEQFTNRIIHYEVLHIYDLIENINESMYMEWYKFTKRKHIDILTDWIIKNARHS